MTTIALDHVTTDVLLDQPVESERPLLTVANPRRTIWTGYAKNAADRLPAN